MNPNRTTRVTLLIAICVAVALIAAFNAINLLEAYGSGPPYYARTINMDKWQNPLPALAVIDVTALVLLLLCARCWRRLASRRKSCKPSP
jgi:hypothetical protein